MGFDGELTMSNAMESLMVALYLDRVPESWQKLAWDSMRSLAAWIQDLQSRYEQLTSWTNNPTDIPLHLVGWIGNLRVFDCSEQVTTQKAKLLTPLFNRCDKRWRRRSRRSKDGGAYCNGFYLEGQDGIWRLAKSSNPYRKRCCADAIVNCKGY